ncbi:putative lysophosphatidic acid:oleoyl-CoA acyltransferase [Penicillium rolfsii]|nr:putative lysophosphatidic acid:oleoyl-CoA acyltransferase [Penicillium rolfsii]
MPAEPDFDRDDREDAPFLPVESNASGSAITPDHPHDDHAKPTRPVPATAPGPTSASKITFRLKLILFAMVLAVEVGFAFLEGPMVRVMESIACRQYYSVADPTKIGANGQVPEELCKVAEIQAELAAVKGYHMFFDGLLSALMAFPYGLLADRRGRKSTLVLGVPGFFLNSVITIVVLWFSDVLPLRAVWLSSLAWLIGGGPVVAFAIIWTMMADVTSEAERAGLFFQFAIVSMGADFVSSALASWLMTMDPWAPLLIGYAIVTGGLLFLFVLPETKHAIPSIHVEPPNVELSDLAEFDSKRTYQKPEEAGMYPGESDVDVGDGHEAHMSWSYPTQQPQSFWGKCRANYRFYMKPYLFILNRKPVLLLLTAFLVYRLSRGSSWFLTQYISTRYHWTLAQANMLVASRPTVSIPVFLWGLPYLKKYALNPRRTSTEKDLWLARASILCLTLGTLGIGLSPSVATLIPSMIIQTSGSGFVFLTRSLITTLVERDETARLYTVIEIIQSFGNVVASLSITTVFQIGLRLGGFWIGLAWMMTSSLFCMVAAAIWFFRLPPTPQTPEFVVGEFDEADDLHGSGIAPFLPIPAEPLGLQAPLRLFLFCFRLPIFIFVTLSYFLVLQWLPLGSLGKKAALWCILGVPSIWWIDLQVDGVRKGSLSKQQQARLPQPGSIIASSFTSPIDAVYLAAIFDPVFTASYPNTRQVEQISLLQAILRAFAQPVADPEPGTKLVDVSTLVEKYPYRPIVIFPECTTTNSRGILPLSHSLLGVPSKTKIFPLSLKYTPVDVVTPLPGSYISFLWTLLSRPTHCIRVRIAECIMIGRTSFDAPPARSTRKSTFNTNYLDTLDEDTATGEVTASEKALLDQVGESLARLGRVKRVGLGVEEKQDFVRMWSKMRRTW